jgi:hypothetical protein
VLVRLTRYAYISSNRSASVWMLCHLFRHDATPQDIARC